MGHIYSYLFGVSDINSDFVLHIPSPSVTDYAILDFPPQKISEVKFMDTNLKVQIIKLKVDCV